MAFAWQDSTVSEIIDKLQQTTIRTMSRMVQEALSENSEIMSINQNQDEILMQFIDNMNEVFDKLTGKVKEERVVVDFENLSLVEDDELTAMVALEGMLASARNLHLPSFISFNTRLNSLFTDVRINESTNPLDPMQVAGSFSRALTRQGLAPYQSIQVYRSFNNLVLRQLDVVLRESNQLLIDHGVIPDLRMDTAKPKAAPTRSSPRSTVAKEFGAFGTVEEETYEPNPDTAEMFSMMQNLLHKESPATAVPEGVPGSGQQQYAVPVSMLPSDGQGNTVMQAFQPAPGEQVQMVDQGQLMDILTNIQKVLEERNGAKESIPSSLEDVEKVNISASLGEMLKENQTEGVINAVDQQSSDIINLVTLLYDAIWQDESVPIPIKELIGRTQITIIKVALSDQTFFNDENHPARELLNEFAEAGIGWIEAENLKEDPLYKQIESSVGRIQTGYDGEVSFFDELNKEFRSFRAKEAAKTRQLEQRILKNKESQERLDDIHELVSQKIQERILGRDLHPFVVELLETHFHKFMVMLVLKEGPGSNAWKQSINTIDVLLWSVQPHEQDGDRGRLTTVNPRLLNNLRKALRIAQLESAKVETLIIELKAVQDESFGAPEPIVEAKAEFTLALEGEAPPLAEITEANTEAEHTIEPPTEDVLDENHPAVHQVDLLSVGMWVEFADDDAQNIRCKLAAKIKAIDKFIFVNRQGVKVVEITRMGLAKELRDGSVRIISDGALFSRALESVIGNLRETQHEQQTGGAYQPVAE
ncbi:MAG: hypothetical protein ACJAR0_001481 [Candidatus Azotimanducaceae bacterium]|jgi:hypothetical protein